MFVDGTHLVMLEGGVSDVPKDPPCFTFRLQSSRFNHVVDVDLFVTCSNDAKTFKEKRIHAKLQKQSKKAIVDEGHQGFSGKFKV